MKIFIRGAAAALALSLVGVMGAEAQLLSGPLYGDGSLGWTDNFYSGTACTSSDVPAASVCDGWFEGNNSGESPPPEQQVIDHVNWHWSGTLGTVTSSDLIESGDLNAGNTGTINFASIMGPFAIALKAGNYFNLALIDSAEEFNSLAYSTVSAPGSPGLSHWTIYLGEETTIVPEPTTLFLLGTGLLGMGFVVWRRREEVLA